MADETQGMSPEDFGLGADLDDVIAEANTADDIEGSGGSGAQSVFEFELMA